MYSAGALISNVEDIYKWHRALYNQQLIKNETLAEATTPFRFLDGTISEYAYGWFIKDIDGLRTIEHSGSTDGYQSDAIYLPQENVFVVALYNCYEADMDWQVLTNDIARVALGKPLRSEVALTDHILKNYVGTYSTTYKNVVHQLIVTLEKGNLFIRATLPDDKLPKVRMCAKSETQFYIKEASLQFEFVKDGDNFKIVTYNRRGKDAEWVKSD